MRCACQQNRQHEQDRPRHRAAATTATTTAAARVTGDGGAGQAQPEDRPVATTAAVVRRTNELVGVELNHAATAAAASYVFEVVELGETGTVACDRIHHTEGRSAAARRLTARARRPVEPSVGSEQQRPDGLAATFGLEIVQRRAHSAVGGERIDHAYPVCAAERRRAV